MKHAPHPDSTPPPIPGETAARPPDAACTAVRERLADFVFDELAAEEHREVQEHLDQCPECRARAARFARTRELAAAALEAGPAPTLAPWRRRLIAGRGRTAPPESNPARHSGAGPLWPLPGWAPGAPRLGQILAIAAAAVVLAGLFMVARFPARSSSNAAPGQRFTVAQAPEKIRARAFSKTARENSPALSGHSPEKGGSQKTPEPAIAAPASARPLASPAPVRPNVSRKRVRTGGSATLRGPAPSLAAELKDLTAPSHRAPARKSPVPKERRPRPSRPPVPTVAAARPRPGNAVAGAVQPAHTPSLFDAGPARAPQIQGNGVESAAAIEGAVEPGATALRLRAPGRARARTLAKAPRPGTSRPLAARVLGAPQKTAAPAVPTLPSGPRAARARMVRKSPPGASLEKLTRTLRAGRRPRPDTVRIEDFAWIALPPPQPTSGGPFILRVFSGRDPLATAPTGLLAVDIGANYLQSPAGVLGMRTANLRVAVRFAPRQRVGIRLLGFGAGNYEKTPPGRFLADLGPLNPGQHVPLVFQFQPLPSGAAGRQGHGISVTLRLLWQAAPGAPEQTFTRSIPGIEFPVRTPQNAPDFFRLACAIHLAECLQRPRAESISGLDRLIAALEQVRRRRPGDASSQKLETLARQVRRLLPPVNPTHPR